MYFIINQGIMKLGKPQSISVLLCADLRDVSTRMERCQSAVLQRHQLQKKEVVTGTHVHVFFSKLTADRPRILRDVSTIRKIQGWLINYCTTIPLIL